MVDTRYGSFIYIHRTYIQQLIVHQLIPACKTGVGRAHISCYASVQQLLGGWQYRLRLIALIATLWHKTIRRELVKTHTLFKHFTKSSETAINTGGARGEECFWKWLTLLYLCHRTIVSALFQSFLGSEFLQEKGHSLFVLWICRILYQPFPLPTLQISYLHG